MKARIITSIGYLIILFVLLILKWLFPTYGALGFDLLFWIVSVFGAYELMCVTGNISKAQYWAALITCAIMIPAFVLAKYLTGAELSLVILLFVGSIGAMATASILVFDHEVSTLKSTAYAELCILYCGALGSVGSVVNHLMINSYVAITMMFFTTVGVDSFAFIFGKLLGKYFPKKLAPHTSPNKTVVGAAGGVIGGVFAASLVYLIFLFLPVSPYAPEGYQLFLCPEGIHPCLLLILISIPTSIAAQLGDLFESAIKRECGKKDMSSLLPGHGGILDRFDSMLFTSVVIVICFMFIR